MINITLSETETAHRLVFYLAMEEYVAANLDRLAAGRDAFFLWLVSPTVILGRNQVMEAEVNIPYCREHGISLFRRKSGGGCVYSDTGNIMLSFISSCTDVEGSFEHFLSRVTEALQAMGLPAERSGRNDILIGGRKVSGNSFFKLPKAGVVHGTMLFDSDFSVLESAITPSKAKISSKGVDSVRSRVANLKPMFLASEDAGIRRFADIEVFKSALTEAFCHGEALVLTEEQVSEIKKIEDGYLEPDFISGRRHGYTLSRSGRVAAGDFSFELLMNGELIEDCNVSGDWFGLKEGFGEALAAALKGCPDKPEELASRLEGFDVAAYVKDLCVKDLLELLCG